MNFGILFPSVFKVVLVFLSVFIGSFSHIIIDALCHRYMTPLYPFDDSNPFFKLISYRTLLISCIFMSLLCLSLTTKSFS